MIPTQLKDLFELVMASYEKLIHASLFRPAREQVVTIRGSVISRLQNSLTARSCMFLGAKVFEAMIKDPETRATSLVKYRSWIELFEQKLSIGFLNGLIPPEILSERLSITLLKLSTTNSINTYQLLREEAPTFLQIVFSDPTLWPRSHSSIKVSLSCVLASPRYEITYFALLDMMCAMAYGLPQVIDYDTSEPPIESYVHAVEWVHGCPFELQRITVRINSLRAWSNIGPVPDWLSIERELQEWKAPTSTTTEDESWKAITRLAIRESWRHALLIYLYMAVCGATSDEPRVSSSVKQVFHIVETIKNKLPLIAHLHFAIQYLIAGAYTPNERQRDIVRRDLSALTSNGFWLLSGSNFVPVLDHLWHGAGANGRPVRWNDYVHSRRFALPVVYTHLFAQYQVASLEVDRWTANMEPGGSSSSALESP
ncbi:Fungal specific transcription factor domain [Ceratobasidium sp. AG-Ba]|nr:Fungal specific transcription factor domain [Ceratobasidium sp. AG-Ba]